MLPLLQAPSPLISILRVVARAMISVAVLCLLSGSIPIIGSIMTIVQGALWLQVCEAPTYYLTPEKLNRRGRVACGGARCGGGGLTGVIASLRGVAICGIFFAIVEALAVTITLGLNSASGYSYRTCSFSGQTISTSSFEGVIFYFGWAAGGTYISSVANVVWGVMTLHILGRLCDAAEATPSERSGLLSSTVVAASVPAAAFAGPSKATGDPEAEFPAARSAPTAPPASGPGSLRRCMTCGADRNPGSRFCPECGAVYS